MTPEEAEKKYGKDVVYKIWNTEWLKTVNCENTPEGLEIPEYEWENAYLNLEPKHL